jgi:hypothetical protein
VDAARFRESVDCLAANVCAAHLAAPGHPLTVLTHPTSSARSPVFGRGFNSALDTAERAGLLVRGRAGVFTTVTATPALLEILPATAWSALRLAGRPPPLILRGVKDEWGRAPVLPVPDTADTRRMAQEVLEVSEWLGSLDVTLAGAAGWTDRAPDGKRLRVATTGHTACLRIFNGGRMDWGGRLYRGWWLTLSKRERFARIRIDGRPVVELDYTGAFLRLAYHHAGVAWPFGEQEDPYLAAPFTVDAARAGMKACTLALLNGAKGRHFPDQAAELFAPGVKAGEVFKAIRGKHRELQRAGTFGGSVGHALTYLESGLMMRVLLRLRRDGLAALPIHDALVTSASNARRVTEIMEGEALRALGCHLPVLMRRGAG